MNEYTYPKSYCICTPGKKLVVNERYDFKEGGIIGECKFLEDLSDEEYYVWKFMWTIHPFVDNCEEFTCSELINKEFVTSGMTTILPVNSYSFKRRIKKNENIIKI